MAGSCDPNSEDLSTANFSIRSPHEDNEQGCDLHINPSEKGEVTEIQLHHSFYSQKPVSDTSAVATSTPPNGDLQYTHFQTAIAASHIPSQLLAFASLSNTCFESLTKWHLQLLLPRPLTKMENTTFGLKETNSFKSHPN